MPGGHSSQRPKTAKLDSQLLRRTIYPDPSVLATASTLTPATLANLSSTQGFIGHPEPQLKRFYSELQLKEYHVLNPLSRATTQGIRSELNSRNTNNPTSEASPKAL
ncbi:hypothetical protein DEO72_LG8g2199 [Vigna unguiculata]|uniref:Uncharacterized protein n=1 Tax=Vigna unguiculata TaxID=3917 RepID=A0A4D6MRS2_VIGUN|nr:hypothetical protein DEO72_LG8g2199 [Vigna unguiculata]